MEAPGEECRCCLARWAGGAGGGRLAELLLACTGVRMDENEALPRSVCARCRERLLEFHAFRTRCQEVDLILREKYLNWRPAGDHDYGDVVFQEVPVLVQLIENGSDGSARAGGVQLRAKHRHRDKRKKKPKNNIKKVKRKKLGQSVKKSNKCQNVAALNNVTVPTLHNLLAVKEECEPPIERDAESATLNLTSNQSEDEDAVTAHEVASEAPLDATTRPHKKKRRLKAYVCERCGYKAADNCSLRVHARFHTGERPFACSHCGKAFAISANLKAHLRTHSGERPFVCEACGRAFSTAASLRGHARVHTGERPYACASCPSAFALRSNLRQHERVHTGVKPYACDRISERSGLRKATTKICAKMFSSSSDARAHLRTHTGERPHACSACPKRFALASNLRAHQRTHSRPDAHYKCAECALEFTCRSALTSHARAHGTQQNSSEDTRQHVCDACGKRFARGSNLAVHRRRQRACSGPADELVLATNQMAALKGDVASTNQDDRTHPSQQDECARRANQEFVAESRAIVTDKPMEPQRAALTFVQIQRAPSVQLQMCADGRAAVATVVPLTLVPISILR